MNLYQAFATDLNHLLDGARAVRITVPGYMPLSVEEIGSSGDGYRLVSLCHYGEQNGDLMRDPDVLFLFHNLPDGMAAEPVAFRNDYLGIVQEVYRYDETGGRTHRPAHAETELNGVCRALVCQSEGSGLLCLDRSSRDPVPVILSICSRA